MTEDTKTYEDSVANWLIAEYLDKQGFKIDPITFQYLKYDQDIKDYKRFKHKELKATMAVKFKHIHFPNAEKKTKVGIDSIENALTLYRYIMYEQYVKTLRDSIQYDPSITYPWDKLVELFDYDGPLYSINNKEKFDYDVHVVKWMFQQIKTKIFSKPLPACRIGMCLWLWSPEHGSGKSSLIADYIFNSFKEISYSVDCAQYLDDKFTNAEERAFIMIGEDIESLSKTQIAVFKKRLTDESRNNREIFTDGDAKIMNNSTWFISSNKAIIDVITDLTGNRRFWEIRTPGDIPLESKIKGFLKEYPMEMAMKSLPVVNELSDSCIYNNFKDIWKYANEHMKKPSQAERIIKETFIFPDPATSKPTEWKSCSELYDIMKKHSILCMERFDYMCAMNLGRALTPYFEKNYPYHIKTIGASSKYLITYVLPKEKEKWLIKQDNKNE